jgi:HEAT repeat protein
MLKDPRGVEPLIACLKDRDIGALAAAWALGELKDPRAVKPLVLFLKDLGLHDAAEEALKKLGHTPP